MSYYRQNISHSFYRLKRMSTVHNRDKVKVDIEAEIGKIVVNVGPMQGCAGMQNVVKIL